MEIPTKILEIPIQQLCLGYMRYEELRKMPPSTFENLWRRCLLEDLNFDREIDKRIIQNAASRLQEARSGVLIYKTTQEP